LQSIFRDEKNALLDKCSKGEEKIAKQEELIQKMEEKNKALQEQMVFNFNIQCT
jgi:hypothetical protein